MPEITCRRFVEGLLFTLARRGVREFHLGEAFQAALGAANRRLVIMTEAPDGRLFSPAEFQDAVNYLGNTKSSWKHGAWLKVQPTPYWKALMLDESPLPGQAQEILANSFLLAYAPLQLRKRPDGRLSLPSYCQSAVVPPPAVA